MSVSASCGRLSPSAAARNRSFSRVGASSSNFRPFWASVRASSRESCRSSWLKRTGMVMDGSGADSEPSGVVAGSGSAASRVLGRRSEASCGAGSSGRRGSAEAAGWSWPLREWRVSRGPRRALDARDSEALRPSGNPGSPGRMLGSITVNSSQKIGGRQSHPPSL